MEAFCKLLTAVKLSTMTATKRLKITSTPNKWKSTKNAMAAYGLPQGQRATTPAEPAPAPESQSELNRISRAGSAALAPVAFTLLGEGICLLTAGAGEPDAVVKQARNGWRAAVCNADSPMVAGKHYVEFKLLVRGYGEINIVSPQANHQLVTSWV